MKILLQIAATFIVFLPNCRTKIISIDESKAVVKRKSNELQCAPKFDKVKLIDLNNACYFCYMGKETEIQSCRSKCYSTSKFEECIKAYYPTFENYYFKLVNEYNRRKIFPSADRERNFTKTDSQFGCPAIFDKKIFEQLNITCSSCHRRYGGVESLQSCRAECFTTSAFKYCVTKTYVDKEYYLNLSNTINKRIIFPLEVTEEVPIVSTEPFTLKTLEPISKSKSNFARFTLEFMEFTEEKHKELNCTTRFVFDRFTVLTLKCFLCHNTIVEFESCRSECFSTEMFKQCVQKLDSNDYKRYLKMAQDYNKEAVHPVKPTPVTKTATYTPLILLSNIHLTIKQHYEVGCNSTFDEAKFENLSVQCYLCHGHLSKKDFHLCRSECFSTPKFQDCIRTINPSHEDYYLQMANDYNQRTVQTTISYEGYPTVTTDLETTTSRIRSNYHLEDIEFTQPVHRAIGCTKRYQKEMFLRLSLWCRMCNLKSRSGFDSCRFKCFSTPNFRDCKFIDAEQLHMSYYKLVNDYNQKTVHPVTEYKYKIFLRTTVTARDLEHTTSPFEQFTTNKEVDSSIKKHEELGCTSQYDQEKFYNLTTICYLCNGLKHSPLFEACRYKCFSSTFYQTCIRRSFSSNSTSYYLNLANDYNGKKIFPIRNKLPLYYPTHVDFSPDKHKELGCTSPYIYNTFMNLTKLCYGCYFYSTDKYYELCRSQCFSTEKFRQCAQIFQPNRFERVLKLANDYNQKEVHPINPEVTSTIYSTSEPVSDL